MGKNEKSDTNFKRDKDATIGCLSVIIIAALIIGGIWFGVHRHNVKKAEAAKQEQLAKQKQVQVKQETEKSKGASKATSANTQKSDTKNVELGQLFKLSDIKDKSQDEVNNIIGQPIGSRKETWHYYDTKEEAPNCFANTYEKNNMEIEMFFIDGKAARVTVTPKDSISSGNVNSILKMFYLSYGNSDFVNEFGMRWNNKFGVYEFDINFESGKVSFIYIVLDEKYK